MRKKPKDKNDSTQNTRCANQKHQFLNRKFQPPEGVQGPGPRPRGKVGGGGELHGEVVDAFLLFLNDTNRVSERAWAVALSLFSLPLGGPGEKQQGLAILVFFVKTTTVLWGVGGHS